MSASQAGYFSLQEFTDLGALMVGGRLYTYASGTTTQKTAYTDAAAAVPQTYTSDGFGGQYIALNARGELPAPLYLAPGSYDITLKRADGSTVWTRRADPISSTSSAITPQTYGAIGDGVTNDTAAIQAAINAALATVIAGDGGGCPVVYIPSGKYLTGPLTITGRLKIRGDGSGSTFLQLTSGSTSSLFTVNAVNVGGTSLDDDNHNIFDGLTLQGNRVDSVTTGVSHGIYCPDTAWSITTQYSPAIMGTDLHIEGFTGSGLFFGNNRNWALLLNVIVRYCNDNGMSSYGYDHRITSCDFGVNKNVGVRLYAGGAVTLTGCNLYVNTINLVVNNTVNAYVDVVSSALDFAVQNGLSVASAPCSVKVTGGRFYGNSTAGANLYSDILVAGVVNSTYLAVKGVEFAFANQRTKYLIETAGNPTIAFTGNMYNRFGAAVPYATSVSNTPAMLESSDDLTINVMKYGAVGDGTTDDSAAINAAAADAKGTGRTLYLPYATYICASQILIDRVRVKSDNAVLKFTTLSAATDCLVLQGSTSFSSLEIDDLNVNANGVGRDAVVVSGGSAAFASSDFMRIRGMQIQGAVRDALSFTPGAANYWIQNFRVSDIKISTPGRHGITMIAGNFSNTFVNQGIFDNIDVRGAGATTAGYDVFCDSQGSAAAQKISEITWISCDLDAAGGASHAQGCFSLNMTGTQSAYDGWTFLCVSPEDTGSVIVGTTKVIVINNSANVRGLTWKGGVVAKYGLIVDAALIGWGEVDCGTGARSFKKNDMTSPGFSTTYANDAAAAAASPPINIGQFYRNGSVVQIRVV